MKPAIIELIRGKDGKRYPGDLPHSPAEHRRLVALSHTLRCIEHLSNPAIQRALLERFAVRRSLGAVWRDVNTFGCPMCVPGARPQPPEEVRRPPTASAAPSPPTASAAPPRRPRARAEVFPWR